MPAPIPRPIVVASPRAAAVRILDARWGGDTEDEYGPRAFDLAAFQLDAVRRARGMLSEWGGVLVADSVGLGKTYVALGLVEEQLGRGGHVLVVTPAALRAQWRTPLRRLGSHDRVMWLSHTRLSRGLPATEPGAAAPAGAASRLVVVDEAHAFRNPRTRRYRELARLCRGARVVLLTATPVNNTLLDLYAQIRLFAGDGAFTDLGVPDLRAAFHAAAQAPAPAAMRMIATVLRAVMIRRTRAVIRDLLERDLLERDLPGARRVAVDQPLSDGSAATPSVAPPPAPGSRFPRLVIAPALRYRLADSYAGAFDDAIALVEALEFAPFRINAYARRSGAAHRGAGDAELMRMLLLKRLESSVAAFAASVRTQARYHESFLEQLAEGRLLAPAEHRALQGPSDAEGTQLLLGALALRPLPRGTDARALARDAAADLERLRLLQRRLEPGTGPDPKLERLRALLEGPLANERVLVFTEFRETARHLWAALRERGGVALIHGGGAFLGHARCGRHEVVARFAPHANGAAAPPPREAVRLLIATDVLSEGLNLQDARHVVSYDLPWNPVRLIQRVGRVDRLGSHHTAVFAHTFLPDQGLDRLLRLLDRIRAKFAAIRAGVGDEPTPLDEPGPAAGGGAATRADRDPPPVVSAALLDDLARGDGTVLDEIDRRDAAAFDAQERLRVAWLGLRRTGRGRVNPPAATVAAVLHVPGFATAARWLVAFRAGGHVRVATVDAGASVEIDGPAASDVLWRALHADAVITRGELDLTVGTRPQASDAPAEPDVGALQAAATAALRALVHGNAARVRDRPGAAARNTGTRLQAQRTSAVRAVSRMILRGLADEPGGPSAALCARAESILARIARGLPIGAERELVAATQRVVGEGGGADALCGRLELVLANARGAQAAAEGAPDPTAPPPPDVRERVEWIAAIEVRAAAD
jgi:superfamily II DNA or RNA helicase